MPITLLQAIGDILRPELQQSAAPIRLSESDPASTCRPVTLNKTGPAAVVKVDGNNQTMFPLFKTSLVGLTAVCDYLVFYQPDDETALFVFLCELKSGRVGGSRRQLENGRILADYIVRVAQFHHQLGTGPALKYRGFVFSPGGALPKLDRKHPCRFDPAQRMPDVGIANLRDGTSYDLNACCA